MKFFRTTLAKGAHSNEVLRDVPTFETDFWHKTFLDLLTIQEDFSLQNLSFQQDRA